MSKFVGVLAAIMIAASTATSLADTPADDAAIGIWASEMVFTPGLHGELVVTRAGNTWRARIGAAEAEASNAADRLKFTFPNNGGEFRAVVEARDLPGFWLQPTGSMTDPGDPGGSGQAFASPLILKAARANEWRGTVVPLDNRFTLYLKIYRDAEGKLAGAFRNPDFNSNGGASIYQVARQGDKVRITQKPAPDAPEIVYEATMRHAPDRLVLDWPDLKRKLELTRRTPQQAKDFFPRPPGEPPYVYRMPAATGDGWATARGTAVGLDEGALARIVQERIAVDPALRRPPLMHSLLVARHGKLVLEEYFFGFDRDRPHDLRSAGKTYASVMLGAAMMQGAKLGLETKVYDVFARQGPFANSDPRKSRITIANLLTHAAGLACDDNDERSPGNEGTMQTQKKEPNWWRYTLDLPVAYEPGVHYAYCSANINLVGGALTVGTNTWLPELFDRTVARPLQFGRYYWNLMPTNEGYLGGGAYVRSRDFLKLGVAYLNGGTWNGRRIVDAAWVPRSTAPVIEISPATTGMSDEQFGNAYSKAADGSYVKDGYAWHLGSVRAPGRTYRAYSATGNGGQILLVVPDLDLAVAMTAGNYMQGGIWTKWPDEIVGGLVIPAIRN